MILATIALGKWKREGRKREAANEPNVLCSLPLSGSRHRES